MCIGQAADMCRKYPDWSVTWLGPGGFGARDGDDELGPATTAPALEALLYAETMRRRQLAS